MSLGWWLLIIMGSLVVAVVIFVVMRWYLSFLAERRIAVYQHDLMLKHYDEVQFIYNQMRGWRHDYHNHIQAMKAFLALGQKEEHAAYLQMLNDDLTGIDTLIKSGNVMVDAIVNSKMNVALSKAIQMNAKATVPENLNVPEVDLSVIIGNLLDNAIEACGLLPEEKRFIRLYIGNHKEMLYVSVSNASGGVKKAGRFYLSTKGSDNHGFGLKRIDKIVEKHGGFVNRQDEEGVFATEVMLPL